MNLARVGYDEYDNAGNSTIQTIDFASSSWDRMFAYDPLSRLEVSTLTEVPGASLQNTASTFNDANRLLTDGIFSYEYDDEGRLVSKQEIGSPLTNHYEYDAQGRLLLFTQVLDQGTPITVVDVGYAYDPQGRRVAKNVNGVVTKYAYDGDNVLHEYNSAGILTAVHTNGIGIDDPLAVRDVLSSQTLYDHADRLGSIVALTDASGLVVQEYVYDAFGSVVFELNPALIQAHLFTARERDLESGLYYYRARYYDPDSGRFITEDPLRLLGGDVNFYNYVGNNPVNGTGLMIV